MGREDIYEDILDEENHIDMQKVLEKIVEKRLYEDAQGIDKEEVRTTWLGTTIDEKTYGRDRDEMGEGTSVLCIVGVIVIIVSIIIYKKQEKMVYEILERKGYDKEFATDFIRTPMWGTHRGNMVNTLRFANKLPFRLDIEAEKEKEYISEEKYVFRGFGKEGEAKSEELIEPPKQVSDGWWQCQHCGRSNAPYVGSCGCGCDKSENMSIGNPEQKQQDAVAVKMLPQRLFCPSCGKQVGPEANFCQYCGAKV